MRKRFILSLSVVCLFLMAADAYAHSWCTTRNRCRTFSKRFVAGAVVGCYWLNPPLCYKRSSSCGSVPTTWCGPKACLWGSAFAWANNGWGGCHKGGWRTGDAKYGGPTEPPTRLPEGVFDHTRGDHDVFSRVEFDAKSQEVRIHLDRISMTSTADASFSRLDVWVFLDSKKRVKETEEEIPNAESIVWHGFFESRDGRINHENFEKVVEKIQFNGEFFNLEVYNVELRIPFFGSQEEFGRLAVTSRVDGGLTAGEGK